MQEQTAQRLKRIRELMDRLRALMDMIDAHTSELHGRPPDSASASTNGREQVNALVREFTRVAATLNEEIRLLELAERVIPESNPPELHERY